MSVKKMTKGEADAGEHLKSSAGKSRKEKENKDIKNKKGKGVKEKKKKTTENKAKSVSSPTSGTDKVDENKGSHVNEQSVQPVKQNIYTLISGDTLHIVSS